MSSDGTTPPGTQAGGQPQINWLARGTATVNTAATLSLVSVNAGEYYVELSASEVSCLGIAAVHYRSVTVIPNSTYFKIVNVDSGDSVRLGMFSLPNVVAEAAGGLITSGTGTGQLSVSAGSVGLKAQTHSQVTILGVTQIGSSVTIAAGTYSSVTVRIDPAQSFSGITVGVSGFAPGTYSGVTVEVSNIDPTMRSEIADSFLARSIAGNADGGRTIQDAFRALRNRVTIDGSRMTVFSEDDISSAWSASITTTSSTALISGIDPAGP